MFVRKGHTPLILDVRAPVTRDMGLDPGSKPAKLNILETVHWLAYKPSCSLATLLSDLAAYGDSGPPQCTLTTGGTLGWSGAMSGQSR